MAFCQRFVEAWEKVYTSRSVSTTSRDPYMVEQFIGAIGDNEAIVYVACQPHDSLDEVCKALQKWLDAHSFAGAKSSTLGKRSRGELHLPEMPVYTSGEPECIDTEALASQINNLKETAEQVKASLAESMKKTSQRTGNFGRNSKNYGKPVEKLPKWAGKYKLVENPRWGFCWFCDEQDPDHHIRNCPKRLKQEKQHPGSTFQKKKPREAEN